MRTCPECGVEFNYKLYPFHAEMQKNNPEKFKRAFANFEPGCPDCIEKEKQREKLEEIERLKAKLGGVSEDIEEEWLEEYNIPSLFIGKDFNNFDQTLHPRAYESIKGYNEGKSFVLLSPGIYGVGKTHLVCSLASYLVSNKVKAYIHEDVNGIQDIVGNYCPVHFVTEQKLLGYIKATYSNKGKWLHKREYTGRNYDGDITEDDIYNELLRFQLLIIDDIGKVRPKDPSFLQQVYFRVVDDRYTNEKDIILTTNLDFKELEEHIGGACADRLREMCGKDGFIKMAGKSYRR